MCWCGRKGLRFCGLDSIPGLGAARNQAQLVANSETLPNWGV